MTPKEKAIELVDKFIHYVNCWDDETADPNYTQAYNYSKQCALIAVDEILDSIDWDYYEGSKQTEHMYWKEVKQEIGKL